MKLDGGWRLADFGHLRIWMRPYVVAGRRFARIGPAVRLRGTWRLVIINDRPLKWRSQLRRQWIKYDLRHIAGVPTLVPVRRGPTIWDEL